MIFKIFFTSFIVILLSCWEIEAHGRLMEPVNRGSAWRKGFETPVNKNDAANFCLGVSPLFINNKKKCGPCGDGLGLPRPRNNENGGKYGTGTVVRQYNSGDEIDLQVELVASHGGHFEFSICKLNSTTDLETEECFDANPLTLDNGTRKFPIKQGEIGVLNMKAILPSNLTCERCVLRWHYHGEEKLGSCGEACKIVPNFRTCSDIAIV